jgi:uncharacterized membrane protein
MGWRWRSAGGEGDRYALPLFALAHLVIFGALFRTVYSTPFSGTSLYYDYAGRVLAGQLPYRDFTVEYPPLALAFFTLPRLVGEPFWMYYLAFQAQVVVVDLVIVAVLQRAARRWALSVWRVLGVYTLAVLAVGPITLQQFDIVAAALSLCAVLWFVRGRDVGAAVFLAAGVMTKVYPILLAPVFLIMGGRAALGRTLRRTVPAFAATCLAAALPWLVIAPASLLTLVRYHATRGLQLESTYASAVLAADKLQLTSADSFFAFGAWNVRGPMADVLTGASSYVLVLLLVAAYVWIAKQAKGPTLDVRFAAGSALFVLLLGLCGSKVFSPQYLIWLLPFVPLSTAGSGGRGWVLFGVIGALSYYLFPLHYAALIDHDTLPVMALVMRNLLVMAFAAYVGWSLRARVWHQP